MARHKVVGANLPHFGYHMSTDLCAVFAAGVELTALGRINRAGNISLQHFRLSRSLLVCRGDGIQKRFCVGVQGMGKNIVRRGHFHHVAQIHHADAVRNVFYNGEVMGDEHISQVLFFLQLLEEVDNLRLNGNV